MDDTHNNVFNFPRKVPTSWLVALLGVLGTFTVSVFLVGMKVETFDGRITAQELHSSMVDEDHRSSLVIRKDLVDEMRALNTRLSRIEGQNEMILRRLR